jgi:3-oxoacyl-[acyl-carrier protein] reductase
MKRSICVATAFSLIEVTLALGIADSDFGKQIVAQTPLGRIGQPKDIGPAAVFLASDESGWITGETLHIAGGNR